jgi:hypothetical protein
VPIAGAILCEISYLGVYLRVYLFITFRVLTARDGFEICSCTSVQCEQLRLGQEQSDEHPKEKCLPHPADQEGSFPQAQG